jgi:hypothetical protein
MILAGFLNIVLLREVGEDRLMRTLGVMANLVLLVFFIILLMISPAPHIIFGAGVFAAATFFLITSKHRRGEIV